MFCFSEEEEENEKEKRKSGMRWMMRRKEDEHGRMEKLLIMFAMM